MGVVMGIVSVKETPNQQFRDEPAKSGKPARSEAATGVLYGVGAYGLWGLLPIYFLLLMPANSVEIVANRVVWSLFFCALIITHQPRLGKSGCGAQEPAHPGHPDAWPGS